MALGAMTLTDTSNSAGCMFDDVVSFVGDNAYPTGGSAFDAALQAATNSTRKIMSAFGYSSGDHHVEYVPGVGGASGKLKVRTAAGAEVANATDLSGATFRVTVLSR